MSEAEEHAVDCVVAGAGVVGLAIARALALAGRDVLVLEATGLVGSDTSARNSEVIHAGLYYRPGTLKARLCVEGRAALYTYCDERGIPHRRCGKLIVATSTAETAGLAAIDAHARACGVTDLQPLSGAEARAMEPALKAEAALLSPSTGIVDSHALMLALRGDLEDAGGMIAFNAPIRGGEVTAHGIRIEVGGAEPMRLVCARFVNAAGHGAVPLARAIAGIPAAAIPPAYFCKGSYFTLSGRAPFTRLVYPVPEQAGLGVHLTLDLGGQTRFGPDTEWVDAPNYDVDPARGEKFYAAIRRYWPALPDGALQPAYAGIRPKIVPAGAPAADFRVDGPAEHGVPGLVQLFGIESPGLTASLVLADLVAAKLG
ncbi:NAD(P)/FAD-dependent oxidoreductase [Ancylobacter dichloromethanicus]|uniref:FAD-dependent oxidoreductase n=1 Tax=Ancylobacter dichloromethanicus TaxID=518825 RepID=A0A9W6J307_9HYPH|nr:NAD(P)/FAD-dependent oxidoreductase [Ancylobacter dichloromethanicus]MBS7556176.1 NAD(P)/FAD-dependent oxidoreductase [Ancylobacter dichloromethanicus]GLK69930.1 FAD-dependent oxidoreductase [Ancylobacter dichloromethanicus]